MELSSNNTLQENLFQTIKSNMESKDFKIADNDPKITKLSENLAKSIRYYIDDLVFRVHDLKADTMIAPGTIQTSAGPNLNPLKVSVKVSQDNPTGITDQPNSLRSVVKVDKNENIDKSGVV